jgi:DeoR family fructose operon transcriptional repressor
LFLEERYEKIIELLEKKGRVTVKELSQAFNVTEDCIRKDLRELENRGNLKRVYGGAMIQRNHSDIKPLDERKNINIDTKRSAALRAVDLIEEGDIVFLDVSTTNLEMAKILNKMDIKVTVVSNMLEIILELRKNPTIRTISIGGEFNKEVGAIVGAAANRYISEFTFDKAFIGVCGVNMDTGNISTLDLEDGNTKKTIIKCSHKSYVLMENEKFNYDEFFKFASITDISSIITEQGIINK